MKADTYTITYESEDAFWWYVARRRIIVQQLEDLIRSMSLREGGLPKLLDFGCGTGANLIALQGMVEAYGADMSASALSYCRGRGIQNTAQVQATDLTNPFEVQFDVITLLDVLEHIEDDAGALASLSSWLRPGGYVFATVPAFDFLWSGEDYVSEHVRRYTAQSLARSFQEAGLSIVRLSYFNMFLFPLQTAVALLNRTFRPESMKTSLVKPIPRLLNQILCGVFSMEAPLLRHVNLPVGSSILCCAQRQHEKPDGLGA